MSAPTLEPGPKTWLTTRERGGVFAIRLTVFLATVLGRTGGRLIARLVTLYYLATSPQVRSGLRAFYTQLGEPRVGLGRLYSHLLAFVYCTFDAFFFVSAKLAPFTVTRTGDHHLAKLRDSKQGAILLGAHVGSFYAMRMASHDERLPLVALMYTKNARVLNQALAELDPEGAAQVFELDPDAGFDAMMKVRERVEQGAIVAILADRIPSNASPDRVVRVPFLGREAAFPAGPFLLAHALRCPVYMTFGLYRGGNRYDLFCEPFAERIELPRGDRRGALERAVQKYAERLEVFVREAPTNWFNFYDFWA